MLPMVIVLYLTFAKVNLSLTVGKQLQLDVLGASITVLLCVFGLGVLTYFDDLILCF